ncbi:hypothetical protein [Abyssisolibacter fermentans]|uniref:hypothetical protein n=1 Tax=Abyssisolibacter fermentans TaxID=1766203 RepID=UPI0008311C17|nr:hypothetical protein [Abyssisolibacter fermentans]
MKQLIIMGVIASFFLAITGCTLSQTNETCAVTQAGDTDKSLTKEEYIVTSTEEIKVGEVIVIGKIMKFDGEFIHIIGGDVVQVYEYNGENKNFYLHQEVQLIKGENKNYLKEFKKDNHTISHTSMGDPIKQINGEVVSFKKDKFTVKSEGKEIEFANFDENLFLNKGERVTVYTIDFGDRNSAVFVLQEDSKLDLTITELTRDKEGNLNALLKDTSNGVYQINLSYESVEFNLADVKVGDTLIVYYNSIMESYPMQLDTVLIRK